MTTFVIATRNRHKVQEIQTILGPAIHLSTLADFPGAPTVIEDAHTFAGNATKKAADLARWLAEMRAEENSAPARSLDRVPIYCLSDDSGLEVDALHGAPGVHSARFAALDSGACGNSSDEENNAKLLRLLDQVPDSKRTARFRCVIAFSRIPQITSQSASPVCNLDEAEIDTVLFDGICEGRIQKEPTGTGGFGYDPLFIPNGYNQSFAELGEETKNRISHRSAALQKLRMWLRNATIV